ncbi:hypothetical protein [Bradyrhizobium embrapense]
MTGTRFGVQGDLVRCSASRGVLASEDENHCSGAEIAIGQSAYDVVRNLFRKNRKLAGLEYDMAMDSLEAERDKVAKDVAIAKAVAAERKHIEAKEPISETSMITASCYRSRQLDSRYEPIRGYDPARSMARCALSWR